MFRKLITGLSFSPSLIGEVALFAKRLKRERQLRLAGLIAVIFAAALNLVATLYPPESTNTASNYDMIYGGVQSTQELLTKYDNNESSLKDIFTTIGITREELTTLSEGVVQPDEAAALVAARTSQASQTEGEQKVHYQKTSGGSGALYFNPISLWNTSLPLSLSAPSHPALIGNSKNIGWFAVLKGSGSLALKTLPNKLIAPAAPPVQFSKKAYNETQRSSNPTTYAHASDRITYELQALNTGDATHTTRFVEQIGDILEYADIVNTGGGALDMRAQTLTWPEMRLAPQESATRQFSIRLKAQLPASARGTSNPLSYDCTITNTLGTAVHTPVLCPPAKYIEAISHKLPPLSATINYGFSLTLVIVASYFYLRARQQEEEVRLIRRDANEGNLS